MKRASAIALRRDRHGCSFGFQTKRQDVTPRARRSLQSAWFGDGSKHEYSSDVLSVHRIMNGEELF